jgi:hypothetical protein
MWHLDIPKTRQYDHGKVEVIAKNSAGEAYSTTTLTVKNRHDDYRALLKNSPRRKTDHLVLFRLSCTIFLSLVEKEFVRSSSDDNFVLLRFVYFSCGGGSASYIVSSKRIMCCLSVLSYYYFIFA